MSEVSELAYKDYMDGMRYKDIAEKYKVSINTVKSWKQRYKWNKESVHTNKKVCTQRKKGGQPGNKNASGPPKNKNAETYGFFSKYLPEETFTIIQEIQKKEPLDILWENINIQYAAIIRAQKIMEVTDKSEMIKELRKQRRGNTSDTDEYEFQFAWNRQATFLQAQSRAMKTLESMIKQYDELLNSSLATEEQKARIELLKSKVSNKDNFNAQEQINALAELIGKPQERESIEND